LSQLSLAERLALDPLARAEFLETLSPEEEKALEHDWSFWARPKQTAPAWAWYAWLILAGRGFGKTRIGAEWVIEQARAGNGRTRIALVAETAADARDVMVEGESGILTISPPWFLPKYEPSKRRLTWPNGARATTFSADEPGQLRGPQFHKAWCDEPAKWRYPETWDQLSFGLRLGDHPQVVLTTTPRPTPLIKQWVADSQGDNPTFALTRGSTLENRGNLAAPFLRNVLRKYQGTRLGRQELDAEILDDAPGALWKRNDIDADRVSSPPEFVRVVIAIDPSVSSDSPEAETGIVAAALGTDGHGYLLADGSIEKPTPEQWGKQGISLYKLHRADRVIGEANNGGDLVEANLRAIDKKVSYRKVHAARGKQTRAEPISSLSEQHRIHHVGSFPQLEDQLCQWEPGVSTWSPNRLDAYVWAFTELMLGSGIAEYDPRYDNDLPDMRI